ncbi:MAG: TRAP transporter permease, partial [Alphaproteobacteria bacterium]
MSGGEGEVAVPRTQSWAVRRVCPVLGALVSVIGLMIAGQLPLLVGLSLYTEQGLAAILGLSIALSCLLIPISRRWGHKGLPWYDVILALAGLAAGFYLAVRYPILAREFYFRPVETLIVGAIILPLTIEGLRRVAGKSLALIVLIFIGYALIADLVPGKMQGRSFSLGELMPLLTIDNVAIFGLPLSIAGSVVIVFIVFGQFLLLSGGSEWFTDLATRLVGRTRGGSAKIAVVASGLFGSISGSAVSNVASTGVITIPMMIKAGFTPRAAAAFEAVASTGGQFMPPVMGAAAFLMAEFLELPYTTIIGAALLPAVLFYFAALIQADFVAARLGIAAVPKDRIRRFRDIIRTGWYFPIPFALLVVALFYLNKGPAEAALWSIASVILFSAAFGYRGKRLGLSDFVTALTQAGRVSIDIVLVSAAAGVIIGVLESTGLGFGLTFSLIAFGEGNLFALLFLTAIVCIVLGMGMPTTGIYILVATLAGPPLIKLGVDPLAAHLFVL